MSDPRTAGLGALMKFISPIRPRMVQVEPKALGIANQLRGGLQPASQLLAQLRGKPGVKAADLEMWSHVPSATKLSPKDFAAQGKAPKLYVQQAAGRSADEDTLQEAAMDIMWSPEFAERRANVLMDLLDESARDAGPDAEEIYGLMSQSRKDTKWEDRVSALLEELGMDPREAYHDMLADEALDIARRQSFGQNFGPTYGDYQRTGRSAAMEGRGGQYFESVLRGGPGPKEASYKFDSNDLHFGNRSQLGHLRGVVNDESMVLDEVQSDPLEVLGEKHPSMRGIYGALGNTAVESAAQAGIPRVLFPSGDEVVSVRPRQHADFYRKIYDEILMRDVLKPLQERGAKLTGHNGWTERDAVGFYELGLPPNLIDAIKSGKQKLNFKKGGLAQVRR